MYKSYRFRIYPSPAQAALLEKHFDCARQFYNILVDKERSIPLSGQESGCQLFQKLCQDHPLIREINPTTLNYVLINFTNTRKRNQALNRKLHFKNHHGRASISLSNNRQSLQLGQKSISVSSFGNIKSRISQQTAGHLVRATLIKAGSGRYYASVLTRQPDIITVLPASKDKLLCIGLDMGITHFMTRSDGIRVDNPRYFQEGLARLRHLQRELARKKRGSANYRKQQIRIARFHERIATRRNAFLHKESTRIVRENDIIVVEKLGIADLIEEKKLSRRICDASWRRFIDMLTYKSRWYGKQLIQINRYCPTTKTCCKCRRQNPHLPLNIREWQCPGCSTRHDRDTNAAINILIEGVKTYLKDCPDHKPKLIPVLSDQR